MSWSSNDNNSPWGKKPRDTKKSSSNQNGSNFNDDYIKGFQDKLKDMFPKNNPTSLSIILLILLGIWT